MLEIINNKTFKNTLKKRRYYKNVMNDPIRKKHYTKKRLLYAKNRILKRRKLINRYKVFKGCSMCGFKKYPQALDLDHINKNIKVNNVSRMIGNSISWKKIKEEIRKCIVLCANCHRIKTYNNKDWLNKTNKRLPHE